MAAKITSKPTGKPFECLSLQVAESYVAYVFFFFGISFVCFYMSYHIYAIFHDGQAQQQPWALSFQLNACHGSCFLLVVFVFASDVCMLFRLRRSWCCGKYVVFRGLHGIGSNPEAKSRKQCQDSKTHCQGI